MGQYFFDLADALFRTLKAGEVATIWYGAETSQFVRFNRGKVRQPGTVRQATAQLTLVADGRQARARFQLTLQRETDDACLKEQCEALRNVLELAPKDPYLCLSETPEHSQHDEQGSLPDPLEVTERIVSLAGGRDLVGLWTSGPLERGFASSLGHRHWHSAESFNFDFSVFARGDKAAKDAYAGTHFDGAELEARIGRAVAASALLEAPERRLEPGTYRAYLAPAALAEIAGLFSWDALSARGLRTKRSPLIRMRDQGARMDRRVFIEENAALGVGPRFLPSGFTVPERVSLIEAGALVGELVSPRSAAEYGLNVNSGDAECPTSLCLAPGTLAEADVLDALDTGIYVTNLWYTNFSDPLACRITGMTRFATTWVEKGRHVAPLGVMRFDDSLYRMLGTELVDLTRHQEWLFDGGTYFERSTDSTRLPGALLRELTLTL